MKRTTPATLPEEERAPEKARKVVLVHTLTPTPEREEPAILEDEGMTSVLDYIPIEDQIKFSGLLGSLCLGTICFGQNWSAMTGKITKQEAEQVFDSYVSQGGNFVDTALNYQDGESVEWLGEWMTKRACRDQLVLAAKYSLPLKYGEINAAGNHRKSLFHAVEDTLRHLRTNYIDILYVHCWDFTTPVEEIMRSIDDLVRLGKVHYVGVSDTPAWQVARANTLATLRGWTPFTAYQGKYNPAERDVETEILPMCKEMGLSVVPWGISEWCCRYSKDLSLPALHEGDGPNASRIDAAVIGLAKETGKTPSQVVLNWAMRRWGVVSPVLTCHSIAELDEAVGALSFSLTAEQVRKLDVASRFVPPYPYKYIGFSYQSSPWFKSAGVIARNTPMPPHAYL